MTMQGPANVKNKDDQFANIVKCTKAINQIGIQKLKQKQSLQKNGVNQMRTVTQKRNECNTQRQE